MKNNYKYIHIGQLIKQVVEERKCEVERISKYFNITIEEVLAIYEQESIDTLQLLKWSKLLRYDFFRIYTQHMVLYSPPALDVERARKNVPVFRKNVYTQELIQFIIDKIHSKQMTIVEAIQYYKIPKTTIYRWVDKYSSSNR